MYRFENRQKIAIPTVLYSIDLIVLICNIMTFLRAYMIHFLQGLYRLFHKIRPCYFSIIDQDLNVKIIMLVTIKSFVGNSVNF